MVTSIDAYATTEEAVFSVRWSVRRPYNASPRVARAVELRVQFRTGGCEEKPLCVIFGVCNSVKTLSRFSHCSDLLPTNV
jgi:hypothetical protein